MSRVFLVPHAEAEAATAAFLATDPDFGLTSVPADVRRGLLELSAPGARSLAAFWPDGDRGHREPAGDEQLAAEWASFAAVVPPATVVEIAVGPLGHRETHWRLVDVLQIGGEDIRRLPTSARRLILLDLYRASLPGGRSLPLPRRELALLATAVDGKDAYAAEGPGRLGDRMAFRRLSAPYDEPWLLAPTGWTTRTGS